MSWERDWSCGVLCPREATLSLELRLMNGLMKVMGESPCIGGVAFRRWSGDPGTLVPQRIHQQGDDRADPPGFHSIPIPACALTVLMLMRKQPQAADCMWVCTTPRCVSTDDARRACCNRSALRGGEPALRRQQHEASTGPTRRPLAVTLVGSGCRCYSATREYTPSICL